MIFTDILMSDPRRNINWRLLRTIMKVLHLPGRNRSFIIYERRRGVARAYIYPPEYDLFYQI